MISLQTERKIFGYLRIAINAFHLVVMAVVVYRINYEGLSWDWLIWGWMIGWFTIPILGLAAVFPVYQIQQFHRRKRIRAMSDDEDRAMFERSFQRPSNYFKLTPRRQWEIDSDLGILDWVGKTMSEADQERFSNHYE